MECARLAAFGEPRTVEELNDGGKSMHANAVEIEYEHSFRPALSFGGPPRGAFGQPLLPMLGKFLAMTEDVVGAVEAEAFSHSSDVSAGPSHSA
jgi:hypothetical protein